MKYSFDSRVRYSEIGEDRHLTLNGMINYFQDCSTFQSEAAGVGMDFLGAKSQAWVLSAWQIVVERYPVLCENIRYPPGLMISGIFWEAGILPWKIQKGI